VLIDDVQENCTGAQALGLGAIWFQDTEQAIAETEAALGEASR
jgi:FMN phosphatase YigB (HAD superfamily)